MDEDGNPAGATIELVRELLHRLEVRATIHILPWKRAYEMGLNENNVALMETTRTPEREDRFKWVGPILVVRRIIYGRDKYDAPLKTIADLRKGGTICVLRGSFNERYLQSLNITQINAVTVPAQCLKMLLADRVQLFYTSEIGMDGLLKDQRFSAGTVVALLDLKKNISTLPFPWMSAMRAFAAGRTLLMQRNAMEQWHASTMAFIPLKQLRTFASLAIPWRSRIIWLI